MQFSDHESSAFAPASIGNVGVGFDVLGLAVGAPGADGRPLGDTVVARINTAHAEVRVISISGEAATVLPSDPAKNTAAIAARHTLETAGVTLGVDLKLHKGLPIGSGLGSSAASAAAGALATNLLLGSPLRKSELIAPCLEAEAAVSGRHADNISASLLGGLTLARSIDPLDVIRLPIPSGLQVVVVSPRIEVLTKSARQALPARIPLTEMVEAQAALAAFVAACHSGDLSLLARSFRVGVDTAARLPLISGAQDVIDSALNAGALGSSISGAGPSIFALCRSLASAQRVAEAMIGAFRAAGHEATHAIGDADARGARRA